MLKERSHRAAPNAAVAARAAGMDVRPTFVEMYREHAQTVARWAARLAGPSVEPEDVVQEVFLIAHRQLDGFRGDSRLSTWLFGITRNVVRHRRRGEQLRRLLLGVARDANAPDTRPTPIEEVERREATSILYRVLDGMAEKYRTVFVLYEIEGLSGPEIAALTGIGEATLRVHLFRARAQFAKRLKLLGIAGPAARGKGSRQ